VVIGPAAGGVMPDGGIAVARVLATGFPRQWGACGASVTLESKAEYLHL